MMSIVVYKEDKPENAGDEGQRVKGHKADDGFFRFGMILGIIDIGDGRRRCLSEGFAAIGAGPVVERRFLFAMIADHKNHLKSL
jgi:hypothetical protein